MVPLKIINVSDFGKKDVLLYSANFLIEKKMTESMRFPLTRNL